MLGQDVPLGRIWCENLGRCLKFKTCSTYLRSGGTEKLERLVHIGRPILPDLLVSYGLA